MVGIWILESEGTFIDPFCLNSRKWKSKHTRSGTLQCRSPITENSLVYLIGI